MHPLTSKLPVPASALPSPPPYTWGWEEGCHTVPSPQGLLSGKKKGHLCLPSPPHTTAQRQQTGSLDTPLPHPSLGEETVPQPWPPGPGTGWVPNICWQQEALAPRVRETAPDSMCMTGPQSKEDSTTLIHSFNLYRASTASQALRGAQAQRGARPKQILPVEECGWVARLGVQRAGWGAVQAESPRREGR